LRDTERIKLAKFTTPEVAERNLRQAYDDTWYTHIRRLIRFTLGETYNASSSGLAVSLSGNVPDDIDLLPRYYEPGQSRRILTNAFLMAAKVCYTEPEPTYPDKSKSKEIVTTAFNKALWKGRPHLGPSKFEEYGEWAPECHRMFLDGDGLGTGFVQIGVRDGWTCIQHHPLCRVIWDRHRLGITRARYVAFIHHLSEEEAVAMFGENIRAEVTTEALGSNELRIVKAIQYFDMGLGNHQPTEMWRLRTLGGKVLDVSENKYGCLPFAHMEHIHLWGMRRPVGRIDFQIANQVMRNAYERYMRLVLERGPGFDAVDTGKMDPEDQEAFESGELLAALRFQVPPMGKIGDYVQRYTAQEVPQTVYKGLEYLDRNEPGESGISDADRANITSSPRTLGEIQTVQEGADTAKEWSQRQYATFLARLFYKANYIAAKLHTAPTPISINGMPVLLNDPGNPRSNLAYWLEPSAWPQVNEDALVKNSPLRRMQIAQGKWAQFLQDPYMNPVEVRRVMLQEMGEKDVDRLLNPQVIAMSQGSGVLGAAMGPGAMGPGMGPGMGGPMARGAGESQPGQAA
jgi:hypothetical protein